MPGGFRLGPPERLRPSLIKVESDGVRSERIAYYTKLPDRFDPLALDKPATPGLR